MSITIYTHFGPSILKIRSAKNHNHLVEEMRKKESSNPEEKELENRI
jgi:hypothetical protein